MNENYANVYRMITRGVFDNTVQYPSKRSASYREELSRYQEEEVNMTNMFKVTLFQVYELTDYSKREKVWELAWEYGHSNGYIEVLSYFNDLVGILPD